MRYQNISPEFMIHLIEKYNLKELRNNVGLVFQYPEHQLFEVDVKEKFKGKNE
mgnify:CR=1 FL=1